MTVPPTLLAHMQDTTKQYLLLANGTQYHVKVNEIDELGRLQLGVCIPLPTEFLQQIVESAQLQERLGIKAQKKVKA